MSGRGGVLSFRGFDFGLRKGDATTQGGARVRREAREDRALVRRAIDNDPAALAQLVERLTPVIHLRVARVLRLRVRHRRSSRQEVEDFVQEIFTFILSDDRRALRSWEPERHASLETFVALLAEHRVFSILRSRRRSPWTEHAATDALLARPLVEKHDPERWFADRELLDRVLDRLAVELGEEGMELLKTVIIAERPLDEVSALTGMSKGALYTWKSRASKRAREIARALLRDG